MKFDKFEYSRPSIEDLHETQARLTREFKDAKSFLEANDVAKKILNYVSHAFSLMTIVDIRHSLDVTDKFYLEEKKFMNGFKPYLEGLVIDFYKLLLSTEYKGDFQAMWGKQVMNLASSTLQTLNEAVFPLLIKENKLISDYQQLIAQAIIEFQGKKYNLKQMGVFINAQDRDCRRSANEAISNFYKNHEAEFDAIFDALVKVRHEIAIGLGEENFTRVAYSRLNRSDYDATMVKVFRENIKTEIIPLAVELRQEQMKVLDLDALYYYDEPIRFKEGAPKPLCSVSDYQQLTMDIFADLDKDMYEYIKVMNEQELMDLPTRSGKAGGGYCTFIPDYSRPFIFMNANGTCGDIETLFHEAGHGYQMYSSRHFSLPQYTGATFELGEVHSMAMEFLVWPCMDRVFGDDTMRYKANHLASSLQSIPYMALVDEFQHGVYENPMMTADERKELWRSLEKEYLPTKKYKDNEFLEKGTFWYRQSHIFAYPFYYIDYALAQVSAFEIWQRANDNRKEAFALYNKLCALGGSRSYFEALEESGLSNPFEAGSVRKIMRGVEKWLKENK